LWRKTGNSLGENRRGKPGELGKNRKGDGEWKAQVGCGGVEVSRYRDG